MRNLILGSEGFVGTALCRCLLEHGEEIIRYDTRRGAHEDLREAQLELDSIDRIYFLAWDVGGAKYLYLEETQHDQLDWNLKILLNLMPQLNLAKVPFLFVSSQLAEEYDNAYGVTKRLGEVWTHIIGGVRVRLWNVYGELEEPSMRSHVVSDFVHQAVMDGRIKMMTSGEERRQFVHIDDVCRAMQMAFDLSPDGIYDITSFEWTTVLRVAQIIAEASGVEVILGAEKGSTPYTPMRGRIPGWLPTVDLVAGLTRMTEELRTMNRS